MLKLKNTNAKLVLFGIIAILFILPWLNTSPSFEQPAEIVSQENVAFYEINPCKVSVFQFIKANPVSIYQNHYHFRFNNFSSINCFGRVTGLTVIDSNFYIAIGTNTLINIIFQGLIFLRF